MALSREATIGLIIAGAAVIIAIIIVVVVVVVRNKKESYQKVIGGMETFKNEDQGKIPQHEDKPMKTEKHVSFEDQFLQSYIENSI